MEEKIYVDEGTLQKIIKELIVVSKYNISSKKYNKHELIGEFQKIIEREVSENEN